MSIKSGLFAAITAVILILVLGSGPVGDNLPESGVAVATGTIHGFFRWDLSGFEGKFKTAQYVSMFVFVVGVFVLGGLAGRARPLAAFVGGWGASIGAAAVSGMVYSLIVGDETAFGGQLSSDVADRVYLSAGEAAGVMVWLGWLFGIAVMLGSFGKGQPKTSPTQPVGGYAPPPPGPPPGQGWDPAGAPPPGAGAPPPAAAPPPGPAPAPAPAPPPGAPDLGKPAPAPPPAAPGAPPAGPHIGPPPDRTQVYGQSPPQQ